MDEIYHTPETAEKVLPMVTMHMMEARRIKRELESIAAKADYRPELLEAQRDKIAGLCQKLTVELDDLEDLGCYVKDLDIGLLDFISTFEGRDIFLCWKLGEAHIMHWHEIDQGFSSRQEMVDLSQLDLEFCFEEQVQHG